MSRKTPDQKIEKFKKELARARSEKAAADRKMRNRRLILTGVAVEKIVYSNPELGRKILPEIAQQLKPADREILLPMLLAVKASLQDADMAPASESSGGV